MVKMISKNPKDGPFDIILVTGDIHIDHPLCGTGIISRVLEKAGFSVGIIEQPDWKSNEDFIKLGKPRLFFGVSSGAMDSMIDNYTPLKKERKYDEFSKYVSKKPDRAVIVYCNKLKENFKGIPIVIGGIEASLRRFGHYDYWINDIRKSILLDSKADILCYGNAEHSTVEIAKRFDEKKELNAIEGTCIAAKEIPKGFEELPAFDKISKNTEESKKEFCKMQLMFSAAKNLAQKHDTRYVLQYKIHNCTSKELDEIYELPYSRDVPKEAEYFKGMQFSVVTHRGCFGNCSFCSLALHQGTKIISRSEESILKEIKQIAKHKDFNGFIDDLGGPSANMYGMDCKSNCSNCLTCAKLDKSHSKLIQLLKKTRKIKGIKKIFIRSGIRYDLAAESNEYLQEISEHHIAGCLKIAPEHFDEKVLKLMNKNFPGKFKIFAEKFNKINEPLNQYIKCYFMTAHPGCTIENTHELAEFFNNLKENSIDVESVQVFTPTPMTLSTCMYYTGMNPLTLEKIYIPYTYAEKKEQKRILYRKP